MCGPTGICGTINGRINALAYEASVIYWLTGEEKYAKFAADILNPVGKRSCLSGTD